LTIVPDIGKLFSVVNYRANIVTATKDCNLINLKKGLTVCLIIDIVVIVVENIYSAELQKFNIYSKYIEKIS